MFELTLANYAAITRSMMENVSPWFAVGILAYKLVVGFAVLKVITGIFIQQTMRVANEDDELLVLQKKRMVDTHAKGVGALFKELDEDGSGALDKQEPLWLQRSSTEQAGGEGAVERDCIQIC
eukprot:g33305.t1